MNATQLLAHFDRLAEAPNAVPRLRRFILDLAVRGKLVKQDVGDEPAVELIKQIQSGKAKRIKSGEVRNPRDLAFPESEAPPFLLPPLWNWVRLADVGAIVGGGTPPAGDSDNFAEGGKGIGWLTPADLGKHKGLFVSHGIRDLTEAGMKAGSATLMPKGSVLFTSRAPIGYVAIAANEISTNQGFKSVVPYLDECSRYIATYLQAFGPQIDSQATGTTFKEVSGKIVSGLPFPLPPLAEQHRIVAKVDELMALCDQLEAAQQEREHRRDRLAAASLQRLNQPATDTTPEAQREHARFYLHHLPCLTTRPEHIKAMRRTILSLAIRGKLLPQSESDEPTPKLLNRIQTHKRQLIAAGKLKAQEQSLAQADLDTEFDLPVNWSWTRLGEVLASSFYGPRFGADEYSRTGVPTIRTTDMTTDGRIVLRDPPKVLVSQERLDDFKCMKGDLLVTRTGSIGTMAVFDAEYLAIPSAYLIRLRFMTDTSVDYLHLVMRSPHGMANLGLNTTKVAQPNINAKSLAAIPIPLPPLAEQYRIVAKVDELMALCDQLEVQLSTIQTDRRRLLDTVLDGILGIVRTSEDSTVITSPHSILDTDLEIGKASRFMTTNPAITVDQLMACIDDLGGSALPDRLLKQTGLGEDVEAFYDLLRAARDSDKVTAPLGGGEIVRRHSNAH